MKESYERFIETFISVIDLNFIKEKDEISKIKKHISIILKKRGLSQVVVKNWDKIDGELLMNICLYINSFYVSVSLFLNNLCKYEKIEKVVCLINNVYVEDENNINDNMIEYLKKTDIPIFFVVDLRNENSIVDINKLKYYAKMLKNKIYNKYIFLIKDNHMKAYINDYFVREYSRGEIVVSSYKN